MASVETFRIRRFLSTSILLNGPFSAFCCRLPSRQNKATQRMANILQRDAIFTKAENQRIDVSEITRNQLPLLFKRPVGWRSMEFSSREPLRTRSLTILIVHSGRSRLH